MQKNELRRLRKDNRRLYKSINISFEDTTLLKHMLAYLAHKRLNDYDLETIRADVLGMAQEAKERKQPLSELIGDDRAFCDGLVANCNKSSLSATICSWLALLFGIAFFINLLDFVFNGGYRLFLGQPYTFAFSAQQMFISILLWTLYVMLWTQLLPLPYAAYKHNGVLFLLVVLSFFVLSATLLKNAIPNNVLLSVSGYTNLAVMAVLALLWQGLSYMVDTLAYRQSALGTKD